MFVKSSESVQLDLFTCASSTFSGKSLSVYEDKLGWHNLYRTNVTMNINESIFDVLYTSKTGAPNASVRVMIGVMILKEAQGLSDAKIFEECGYNVLTRSALGLLNWDDCCPTESTCYLFRQSIQRYAQDGKGDLMALMFADLTTKQCSGFEVSGKRICIDNKVLGSNIAWLSRYEIVQDTNAVMAPDVDFLLPGINASTNLIKEKPEVAHTDGAYNSPDNQTFCKKNTINLRPHAIQGKISDYKLIITESGDVSVFLRETGQDMEALKKECKDGSIKWRIKTLLSKYRYFTQKDIDGQLLREKIAKTPFEELRKRNNVEATIFQIGYHYPNDKSRYREVIKHNMWANIRCIWVNFVRIEKFIDKTAVSPIFSLILITSKAIKPTYSCIQKTFCLSDLYNSHLLLKYYLRSA